MEEEPVDDSVLNGETKKVLKIFLKLENPKAVDKNGKKMDTNSSSAISQDDFKVFLIILDLIVIYYFNR